MASDTPTPERPENPAAHAEGAKFVPQPHATRLDLLRQSWSSLSNDEQEDNFKKLPRVEAEELFLELSSPEQAEIYIWTPVNERRSWIRLLAPDDAADLIQDLSSEARTEALLLLDEQTRSEVTALLAYAEDDAGGLMNSRFARIRPEMSVDEAIRYLRAQTRTQVETIYYAYVLDSSQHLLGVVSLRQLFTSPNDRPIREVMRTEIVTIPEDMDQEQVALVFAQNDLVALPVVDHFGTMKGIVTVDDVVGVVQEEATEDIQKIGGTEALDMPYLKTSFLEMLKKRAGWLTLLFIGEMFTATAMAYFEHAIAKAVVLALFIPLIISSGGNSGSQATTLIIRSLALGELKIRDWWRVFTRELQAGLALGAILGIIGFLRITFWPWSAQVYGEHYMMIAIVVSSSLVGIVMWGCVVGAMLPFCLRRLGFDPASASAPLVATLVDVSGLVIYFTVASIVLRGSLL